MTFATYLLVTTDFPQRLSGASCKCRLGFAKPASKKLHSSADLIDAISGDHNCLEIGNKTDLRERNVKRSHLLSGSCKITIIVGYLVTFIDKIH